MRTMEPTAHVRVRVTGARAASAPTTWGHRAIWLWHGVADETEEAHFNNGEWFRIPVGATVDSVVGAVQSALHGHDALRTTFHHEEGAWRQVVEGAGEVTLEVYEVGEPCDDAVARLVAGRLTGQPWPVRQWPLRVAVVVCGGVPAYLVVATNRLAIDGKSVAAVAESIVTASVTHTSVAPAPWQPVDEALFEQSAEGQAANERALRHWREVLSTAPPSMFDLPMHEPDALRFHLLKMDSPALAAAVRMVSRRWRMSHSVLVLAAASIVLARYAGHDSAVMQMMSGNRLDRLRRALVGTLTAEGVYYLDVGSGAPFSELAREAFRASGRAHRFAFCDPHAVAALRAELEWQRGAHIDLGAVYNAPQQTRSQDVPDGGDLSESDLTDLTESTVVKDDGAWPRSPAQLDLRLYLRTGHRHDIPLTLLSDTKYVPVEAMREFLVGIERVMVAAACGTEDVDQLAEVSGVTPAPRGPAWIRRDDAWVDLTASRRLWQHVAGTDAAALVAGSSAGDNRLVGYLAAPGRPDFHQLHRVCVKALNERSDVRTPDLYRWVAKTPVEPTDPVAWREAQVLAEHDGR